MLKYIFLGISKNKKLYIPLFCILALMLFALAVTFTIRMQVAAMGDNPMGIVPVVAVTHRIYLDSHNYSIDDGFIARYALPEYVVGKYAFTELLAYSNILIPVSTPELRAGGWPWANFGYRFRLVLYTCIQQSIHFKAGDRAITHGRFAADINEANVSTALAEYNGLRVGDKLTLYLPLGESSQRLELEIVGIFIDNTAEIGQELPEFSTVRHPHVFPDRPDFRLHTAGGWDSLSRNQILTAAPTASALASLRGGARITDGIISTDDMGAAATQVAMIKRSLTLYFPGYNTVVYYLRDGQSAATFVSYLATTLPAQLVVLDNMDASRYLYRVLSLYSQNATRLLIGFGMVNVLFCVLLIFYVLKGRTYDIGVLRAKGMSRLRVTSWLTGEIFVVAVLAFSAAVGLYFAAYVPLVEHIYDFQELVVNVDWGFRAPLNSMAVTRARNFEFRTLISPRQLLLGFVATVVLTGLSAFGAVLYVARHEPMKTITGY
ncbi:MAG: FtsX-like permease family protein [Firmicutes bacterium]|nr:FtsX-like permease family protein [Bacillota bacterium]